MRFDLSKYSTVAERLAQFHKDHPDGRIVTDWESSYTVTGEQGQKNIWVIKSYVYLTAGDQANQLPKATGYAFEIDGTGGANQTSALENAESSSVGRALMLAGYSANKDPNTLASREEIQKVQRGTSRDWLQESTKLTTKEELRVLWADAKAANASDAVLKQIKERADGLDSNSSLGGGIEGSVSGLFEAEATSGKGWAADPEPKAGGRK